MSGAPAVARRLENQAQTYRKTSEDDHFGASWADGEEVVIAERDRKGTGAKNAAGATAIAATCGHTNIDAARAMRRVALRSARSPGAAMPGALTPGAAIDPASTA